LAKERINMAVTECLRRHQSPRTDAASREKVISSSLDDEELQGSEMNEMNELN